MHHPAAGPTHSDAADSFQTRHIGPRPSDLDAMLRVVGSPSLDALISEAVPEVIRLTRPLDIPPAESEHEFLKHMKALGNHNQLFRSYIGMGYYGCITPSVILRTVLENPSWYTPYTPYQAEIAQGRLEALLNFQTMVGDLTGMEIANASLLDEATAAAEAMAMLHRLQGRRASEANRFLISRACFPQTIDVVKGRAEPLGISVETQPTQQMQFAPDLFGVLVQYPDGDGQLDDLRPLVARAHEAGVLVAVASDLLALTLLAAPGDVGADVVVGNSQRFGVPMGYGGPHAAFFSTRGDYVRQVPGRLIGVSVDAQGNRALRMALQTREQHIRRERATSNICTAQALLANMAGMYAVYHGPHGLTAIARRVHGLARLLSDELDRLGLTQVNRHFFDTLKVEAPGGSRAALEDIRRLALEAGINFRYFSTPHIGISLDETTSLEDVRAIADVFARHLGQTPRDIGPLNLASLSPCGGVGVGVGASLEWPSSIKRTSEFLTHRVFNSHHSETQMMRYLKALERKDIGLDTSMIPLGSCTMKLNAASQMRPVTWPEFAELHPFAPREQARGYSQIFGELERALCAMTGLAAVSLQPNSGAQGELTGLLVIRAYQRDRGEGSRDVVLIPASAHGTNPATATMAGLRVVVVACDARGNVDVEDLRAKAEAHRGRVSALMITYPSTHGVFEEGVRDICTIVHEHGGQVYMDGANINAQVGLTSPAIIGADVCHLNLHKTFSIPHGGGGPGMGPIAVGSHLAPYLPGHPVVPIGTPKSIAAVAAAPWGSASILLISYGYIRMLGRHGLKAASQCAILNANYVKSRLERHYDVLYARANGRVAHEMIFDLRPFKQPAGVTELDVAKRLMDYGFHAPTVSFPVAGTLMIEPTECEDKDELDRFCDAMIAIRQEMQAIIDGKAHPLDNVLKNAPHTAAEAARGDWPHPYSRAEAVFPLPFVCANKFWPPVARIDNAYGDRHLSCVCPPVETYAEPSDGAGPQSGPT
jgi:glycine dehydrogenase